MIDESGAHAESLSVSMSSSKIWRWESTIGEACCPVLGSTLQPAKDLKPLGEGPVPGPLSENAINIYSTV